MTRPKRHTHVPVVFTPALTALNPYGMVAARELIPGRFYRCSICGEPLYGVPA